MCIRDRVEGSDLLVRDARVYLKTLKGLVPIHGLLKRVDDQYMDPLELRPDSTLGVPGLLQAMRAGNVLVANAPGSAFLESPALLGFLPALSRQVFEEELTLPALPTWWCGEHGAMLDALARLRDCAIKPTYPGSPSHGSFDAVLGATQDARRLDEWAGRIARQPEEHTVQVYAPLSQMPTWQTASAVDSGSHLLARSVILRVFAISDGAQAWRVLPGGLARVASVGQEFTSMQRWGISADVCALTQGEVDHATPVSYTHLDVDKRQTQARFADLAIAVNVSARQFRQGDFVDQVLATLMRTRANPQRLKLELTESLLVDDVEDVIAKMTALKSLGVGFSLDDFGTAYSSLAYLSRLPLDQLKIDQSFVKDIESSDNAVAICAATISLAHSLKPVSYTHLDVYKRQALDGWLPVPRLTPRGLELRGTAGQRL